MNSMVTHDFDGLRCRTAAGRIVGFTTSLRRCRADIVSVLWHDHDRALDRDASEYPVDAIVLGTDADDEIRLSCYLAGDDDFTGSTFTTVYAELRHPSSLKPAQ